MSTDTQLQGCYAFLKATLFQRPGMDGRVDLSALVDTEEKRMNLGPGPVKSCKPSHDFRLVLEFPLEAGQNKSSTSR